MRPIAIDFDSTAWPFLHAFGPLAPRLPDGRIIRYDICPTYHTVADLFLVDGEFDLALMLDTFTQAHNPQALREVGLYDGFAEAASTLRDEGQEIVILTDISEQSADWIRAYFVELSLDWLPVIRCFGHDKVQWCLDNDAVLLIDDAPQAILDAAAAGVPVLSFRFAYNRQALAESDAFSVFEPGNWQGMLAAIRRKLQLAAVPV